jgi:alkanesulfonate monooxygenase SsuD/methylene tetrahydromethanopterin reductase-like flavin-dependent oxidoreductase (luciferase family)
MRFGFITEGETRPGATHYHRYHELVEQVLLAEKVGFDLFGSSEQHFALGGATVSCPEVLYPYLMALTSRIRFIHAVALLPRNFNHPLRVAERLATEDILSDGRVELGTGRGNTPLALRAFEVRADENKSQWDEGIELIRRAFLDDPFMFEGEHYKVPPRSLVPKPVQLPHPPFSMAATSPDSHRQAGEKGIGVISSSSYLGQSYSANALKLYDEAFEATDHPFPVNYSRAFYIGGTMHCAETTAEAREQALPAVRYAGLSVGGYERLSKLSADYAYMGAVKDVDFTDVEYMYDRSAGFLVGDPDSCVRQIEELQELGIDTLLMRIDSVPHEQMLRSIELFGKYVIPRFKRPTTVVRPADDVLEQIRALRPEHEARLEALARDGAADGRAGIAAD